MNGLKLDVDVDLSRRHHTSSYINCCCGRPDCALLKQNCSVLETLEKDVHTAAQLGQVRVEDLKVAFQSSLLLLYSPFLYGDTYPPTFMARGSL